MIKLAASSGIVIYEAGNKLYISKSPAGWINTFRPSRSLTKKYFVVAGFTHTINSNKTFQTILAPLL